MSIIEIAKLAGVSHTTVSRVINNENNVSPETATKVRAVMKAVGYVPKPPSLRRGPRIIKESAFKTGNVAFLVSSESLQVLSRSPIMLDVLHGIEDSLAGYGMSMLQGVINAGRQLPPIVARGGVDGVIIWPNLDGVHEDVVEVLRKFKIVYVMTAVEERVSGDRVQNNNREIGRMAAEYLYGKGHHKLGYITPSALIFQRNMCDRWLAFSNFVRDKGIQATQVVIEQSKTDLLRVDSEQELVIANVIRELFGPASFPTGIFITCDSLTAKLYPILRSLGIDPGRDVEIISCNNEVQFLTGLDPKPTVIDIQAEKIGRKAVDQLRWRITHPEDESQITIEIQPKLLG